MYRGNSIEGSNPSLTATDPGARAMKIKDEAVNRFFEQKLPAQRPCESCGGADWTYERTLYELREYEAGALTIGGGSAATPMLAMTCGSCGRTNLYNAVVAGLVDAHGRPVD